MKIYRGIIQGTPEWENLRKLHFTATDATAVIARGKGLKTLIKNKLAEYYSSENYTEYTGKYKDLQMQRGNDMEETARRIYELETGNSVEQVGFIETDEYEGCSPDGLVNEDGLLEIKNHSDPVFIELVLTGKIDSKYTNQMQMQMYVSNRKWCDYFAFNPNFSPNFFLKRIYRDEDMMIKIHEGLEEGKENLKAQKEILDKMFTKE